MSGIVRASGDIFDAMKFARSRGVQRAVLSRFTTAKAAFDCGIGRTPPHSARSTLAASTPMLALRKQAAPSGQDNDDPAGDTF
ncbi:hypothetical protein [Cupriavidus phytorum]|uniref:hypothetical protein n=1 Tax=Cupriavidus phytorum TaxID=3024399 RepID=UPI0011B4AE96|nr:MULTISPECIES: hypothetical protein [Cupriavidus]